MVESLEDLALNWVLLLHDDFIGERKKASFLSYHLTIGWGGVRDQLFTPVGQKNHGLSTNTVFGRFDSLCLGCICTIPKNIMWF